MSWAILIKRIDYHHKKWYVREFGANGEWIESSVPFGLIEELAPGCDPGEIVKLFYYRDRDARARLQ